MALWDDLGLEDGGRAVSGVGGWGGGQSVACFLGHDGLILGHDGLIFGPYGLIFGP